MQAESKFFPQC